MFDFADYGNGEFLGLFFVTSLFGHKIVIVGNTVKLTTMDFLFFFPEEIIIILISKKSRGQEYYV